VEVGELEYSRWLEYSGQLEYSPASLGESVDAGGVPAGAPVPHKLPVTVTVALAGLAGLITPTPTPPPLACACAPAPLARLAATAAISRYLIQSTHGRGVLEHGSTLAPAASPGGCVSEERPLLACIGAGVAAPDLILPRLFLLLHWRNQRWSEGWRLAGSAGGPAGGSGAHGRRHRCTERRQKLTIGILGFIAASGSGSCAPPAVVWAGFPLSSAGGSCVRSCSCSSGWSCSSEWSCVTGNAAAFGWHHPAVHVHHVPRCPCLHLRPRWYSR